MSKFTPTQAEKDALSYLDWDDAALGRFTKHVACKLEALAKDGEGLRKVTAASCAMMLVGLTHQSNAATLTLELGDHTHKEIPTGDWIVTVQLIKAPEHQLDSVPTCTSSAERASTSTSERENLACFEMKEGAQ